MLVETACGRATVAPCAYARLFFADQETAQTLLIKLYHLCHEQDFEPAIALITPNTTPQPSTGIETLTNASAVSTVVGS